MQDKSKVVLVTTTFYTSRDDVRFGLALKTMEAARTEGYQIIVVDGSPETWVADEFRSLGATVIPQEGQGMGASRRQVFKAALYTEAEAIVWLEPEKHPVVPLLGPSIEMILDQGYDIVLPARESLESYPPYQELSEFRAIHAIQRITGRGFDWFFGPRVLNRRATELLMSYVGEPGKDNWQILFLPILWALAGPDGCYKIGQVTMAYVHPSEQTAAEIGDKAMNAKRDQQRIDLVAAVQEEADRIGLRPAP